MPQRTNLPLPQYRVRHSARAKRASIRIVPGLGVEVLLPSHWDGRLAEGLVRDKLGWIRDTLRRLGLEEGGGGSLLPQAVRLEALERDFPVRYPSTKGGRLRLIENAGTLQFFGSGSEAEHCRALCTWLKGQARGFLPPLLHDLETRTGLEGRGVSIRLQRSRWGSCSSRHGLSLNAALLFLPLDLVRYVLLHELCHTRELNHSERFWALVRSLDPEAPTLDRRLNRAWRLVPAWAQPV